MPQDVSVVGFDDVQSAAFQNPGLTTVRQPLQKMGVLAAQTVLQQIMDPALWCVDQHAHRNAAHAESRRQSENLSRN